MEAYYLDKSIVGDLLIEEEYCRSDLTLIVQWLTIITTWAKVLQVQPYFDGHHKTFNFNIKIKTSIVFL